MEGAKLGFKMGDRAHLQPTSCDRPSATDTHKIAKPKLLIPLKPAVNSCQERRSHASLYCISRETYNEHGRCHLHILCFLHVSPAILLNIAGS